MKKENHSLKINKIIFPIKTVPFKVQIRLIKMDQFLHYEKTLIFKYSLTNRFLTFIRINITVSPMIEEATWLIKAKFQNRKTSINYIKEIREM